MSQTEHAPVATNLAATPSQEGTSIADKSKIENAEKAVKMLIENHRLMLTFIGLIVAGLFAYAGRGQNVIGKLYLSGLFCLLLSGLLVAISMSVSIDQARSGRYNAYDAWMKHPYTAAQILLLAGIILTFMTMVSTSSNTQVTLPTGGGVRVENKVITIAPDSKLKVHTEYSPNGALSSIEVSPP